MKADIRQSKLTPRSSFGAPWRSHRDLDAYKRSIDLLVHVQRVCKKLPGEDRFDLGDQMRRASKSIPANIAEGFGKKASEKEFKQYMKTAMASATEMETHLDVAARLGYVKGKELQVLLEGYSHVGQQLNRLIAYWSHF
jgi:four helix bundle protein